MRWIEDLADVAEALPPNPYIVLHSGFAEPQTLGRMLGRTPALAGASVATMMPMGETPWLGVGLRPVTFMPGKSLRRAINDGSARLHHTTLSGIPALFASGEVRADAVFLQLSPPDADGLCSLGISVDYMRQVLAQNPLVVAEINPQMPRTAGDTGISVDQIDFACRVDAPPLIWDPTYADPTDARIAAHVATLIEDGDTVQYGIGAIPEQSMAALRDHRRLRIHTGLLTGVALDLAALGVLADAPIVTTLAGGTAAFYRALDDQAPGGQGSGKPGQVIFRESRYTHGQATLATVPRLKAINSVLQIDLAGRANAERVGGRIVSSPGGLPDFAAAASAQPEGASILAMRSTSPKGDASSILPALPGDAPTTIGLDHIDYVVTEYGIADLRDITRNAGDPDDCARALIAIAHPDFQAMLRETPR